MIRNLTVGSNHTLLCVIEGLNDLIPANIYQWTHFNGNECQVVGGNSQILFFPYLRLSDAGEYTCTVNISSLLLNSDIDTQSTTHKVLIKCRYFVYISYVIG